MSIPDDHHFLPVFYLNRWLTAKGLVEFARRGNGEIAPRACYPKSTAYKPGLYANRFDPDPVKAQALESDFLQGVDSAAAKTLALMEENTNPVWNAEQRSEWSRFIMSLLQRTPEEVEEFKQGYADELQIVTKDEQAQYAALRLPNDPPTLGEFIAQRPRLAEGGALRTLRNLMDHEGLGRIINEMVWSTIRTPTSKFDILTSDRPVLMTITLKEANAYIILPIGPRHLFAATKDRATLAMLCKQDETALVRKVNEQVVAHAVRFAYGRDATQLRFVQNHLSKKKFEPMFQRLNRLRLQSRNST